MGRSTFGNETWGSWFPTVHGSCVHRIASRLQYSLRPPRTVWISRSPAYTPVNTTPVLCFYLHFLLSSFTCVYACESLGCLAVDLHVALSSSACVHVVRQSSFLCIMDKSVTTYHISRVYWSPVSTPARTILQGTFISTATWDIFLPPPSLRLAAWSYILHLPACTRIIWGARIPTSRLPLPAYTQVYGERGSPHRRRPWTRV